MNSIWHQIWSMAFLVGVIGNLVASLLWAFPALRHLHKKIDRNHAEHMEHIKLLHKAIHGTIPAGKEKDSNAIQHP